MGIDTLHDDNVVRILVVDDNAAVRRYLRGVLEQNANWRVCDEARNGQEAVDRVQTIHPDVVVLDFQMPEMNGLEAARVISQLYPKTPILMVTLYLSTKKKSALKHPLIRQNFPGTIILIGLRIKIQYSFFQNPICTKLYTIRYQI